MKYFIQVLIGSTIAFSTLANYWILGIDTIGRFWEMVIVAIPTFCLIMILITLDVKLVSKGDTDK